EHELASLVNAALAAPCTHEAAAHRLGWAVGLPRQFGQVDVDGLLLGVVALRYGGDGEEPRATHQVVGVELVGVGGDGVAQVGFCIHGQISISSSMAQSGGLRVWISSG